jgi:hypothetical protein
MVTKKSLSAFECNKQQHGTCESAISLYLDRIGIFIFVPDFEALIAEQLSSMETFV